MDSYDNEWVCLLLFDYDLFPAPRKDQDNVD